MLTPAQKKAATLEKRRRKAARVEFLKALGARVRELALKQGIKASLIAAECHVSRQAVNDWFTTGRIHKDHLPKLARLLGCTIFDLLGDTPVPLSNAVISAHAQYLAELFDELPPEDQQTIWPALLRLMERQSNDPLPAGVPLRMPMQKRKH